MAKYQHVLLAADLIRQDDDFVSEKAAEIAQISGAKLSIIHIIEFPYTYSITDETTITNHWLMDLEKTAKEAFNTLSHRLGIPPERRHMINGEAKKAIVHVAERIEADLIVVGSHGRHGLGLFLFGSTANAVLHAAKCDILAIRVPY